MWCNIGFAEDIEEFEIEGISVGDSLLDYLSKEEITKFNIDSNKDALFNRIQLLTENYPLLQIYDGMYIYIKRNDKKYIIHGLEGMIDFPNDITNCKIKKKEILNEISSIFKNSKKTSKDKNNIKDGSGFSRVYVDYISISPNSMYYELELGCYDSSEESGYMDHFRISLIKDELNATF